MATTIERGTFSREKAHEYLKGAIWPMARAMLLDVAEYNEAPPEFTRALAKAANRFYVSEEDLWQELALGREDEGRGEPGKAELRELAGEPTDGAADNGQGAETSEPVRFVKAFIEMARRLA